ncbi:hypothetical protein GCM10009759_36730 [Kitasatospora saccharophila]|uniref:Uncharacterized protein n=1 Tax=Kitasatospora saccharophila TaxID=407973 RepID=A0ABN2X358_9ACTN
MSEPAPHRYLPDQERAVRPLRRPLLQKWEQATEAISIYNNNSRTFLKAHSEFIETVVPGGPTGYIWGATLKEAHSALDPTEMAFIP